MKRADDREVFTEMLRALQAMHAEAHRALVNWGAWSRDRRGIFPSSGRVGLWDAIDRKEWDAEGYGEPAPEQVQPDVPIKAERPEEEKYSELEGYELDQRIHGYGGLPDYQRRVLRAAYVTREVPEDQFPAMAGCTADTFKERLEACLLFVDGAIPKTYKAKG